MTWATDLFGRLLACFYEYTGDYGIAILCLTILARLCLAPFQAAQRRSMEERQGSPAGCLLLVLQLPVMVCLYRAIRAGVTARMGTKLLPWATSLLLRDPYGILPMLSVVVQLIPQLFPYLAFFRSLELPRPTPGTLLATAAVTALICFPLPAGVGIYYLASGLFSASDQLAWNIWKVQSLKNRQAAA